MLHVYILHARHHIMTEYNQATTPKVSVIIVTYHAEKTLEKCIKSVLTQSLENIELIIIDGNSSDRTNKIIIKYSKQIAYSISEPDQGVYDAMNKGIDHAHGEWILFLGADDQIHQTNTISNLLKKEDSTFDLIVGNIIYDTGYKFRPHFNWRMLFKNTLHHQGVLYNSRVFSCFRYDSMQQISGDYELNLKLYLAGAKYKLLSETISICATKGASHRANPIGYREEINIRQHLLQQHVFICPLLNMLTLMRLHVKKTLALFNHEGV